MGRDFTSDQFLADLASEIDHLGLGEFEESKTSQPAEAAQGNGQSSCVIEW